MPAVAMVAVAAAGSIGAAAINARAASKAAKTQADAEQQNIAALERMQRYRMNKMRDRAPEFQNRYSDFDALGDQGLRKLGVAPTARPSTPFPTFDDREMDELFPTTAPSSSYLQRTRRGASGPRIGETKVFPNQRVGRWDGQGWVAVN